MLGSRHPLSYIPNYIYKAQYHQRSITPSDLQTVTLGRPSELRQHRRSFKFPVQNTLKTLFMKANVQVTIQDLSRLWFVGELKPDKIRSRKYCLFEMCKAYFTPATHSCLQQLIAFGTRCFPSWCSSCLGAKGHHHQSASSQSTALPGAGPRKHQTSILVSTVSPPHNHRVENF